MQQWRAARVRTRTDKPADISYPPLVMARERAASAKEARQQKMLRLYQRHHAGAPADGDEDAAMEDMLRWCTELHVKDYFECVLLLIGPCVWASEHSIATERAVWKSKHSPQDALRVG